MTRYVAVSLIAGWLLSINSVVARPVDLSSPSGQLGSSNARGFLEIWREVSGVGIELGVGSYLPLRYKFTTESARDGVLGAGFYVPMFEAKNNLIREDTMLANLPCGKKLYLWRDATDTSKFHTPDRQWSGNLSADDFTLERGDGWRLLYRQGRLISSTSDDGQTFDWIYDSTGGASVGKDGKPLVVMETGVDKHVVDFVFAGKSYKVEFGRRPIFQTVSGQSTIKELVPAMAKLEFPDSKAQTFEFGLNDVNSPMLTAVESNGKSTEYTWDPISNHIATEKGPTNRWVYTVGNAAKNNELPSLSRQNANGKTEGVAVDSSRGIYNVKNIDGSTEITTVFKTPGPLYGKVQKITRLVNGSTNTVYHASYNQEGQLIRSLDENGFETIYTYNTEGKLQNKTTALSQNPELHARLTDEEKLLLANIYKASTAMMYDNALTTLAFFYLDKMADASKAQAIVPKISDKTMSFNVIFNCVCKDNHLSNTQKREQLKILALIYPERTAFLSQFGK